MKRVSKIVVTLAALAALGALLVPYIISRVNWYNIDSGWNGASNLVACHAGTPLFARSGYGFEPDLPSERTARLDAWIACKSINAHRETLVTHQSFDGNNSALRDLVTKRFGCLDQRFDKVQSALCESAIEESIDWLLENGVEINPANNCGYLRATFTDVLDAKMFEFLLSRGANVETECPRRAAQDGDSAAAIEPTSTTVIDDLRRHLSWLDADEFPDVAAQYSQMIALAEASLGDI